jgi:hypothetical protein
MGFRALPVSEVRLKREMPELGSVCSSVRSSSQRRNVEFVAPVGFNCMHGDRPTQCISIDYRTAFRAPRSRVNLAHVIARVLAATGCMAASSVTINARPGLGNGLDSSPIRAKPRARVSPPSTLAKYLIVVGSSKAEH